MPHGPPEGILNHKERSPMDLSFFFPKRQPKPEPKAKPRRVEIKPIRVFDKKAEKAHDKAMKLAAKALKGDFRLPRDEPLTLAEAKEMRALRQRERRASKAIETAIL
jgi:hypothetical protein